MREQLLCGQELRHRSSQLDAHIPAFIALFLLEKESVNTSFFPGANPAIVDLFQSMIPEAKNNIDEMFGLECVSRAVRNMGKEFLCLLRRTQQIMISKRNQ